MAVNLPLSGGARAFGDNEGSSFGAVHEAAPSNGQSTLKASDKEKIEEVIAMMPQTWLNPLVATQIWNQIGAALSLKPGQVSQDKAVGNLESSIVLAMILTFAESNTKKERTHKADPINVALQDYVERGKSTALNGELLQMIQKSPLLLNSLRAADPKMVVKAYETALQTIIPSMYDKLVTGQQAALMQAPTTATEAKKGQAAQNIAKAFLEDVQVNPGTLSHPFLSVAFAGIIGGSQVQVPILVDPKTGITVLDPSKDSIMPAGQSVISDMLSELGGSLGQEVEATLAATLSQLVSNVQVSSAYWSIPGALTLKEEAPTGDTLKASPSEAEVRSYAATIARFVLQPQFEQLARSVMLKYAPKDAISEERMQVYIATMKVMLLTNALGAMDKVLMQSVVIRAADIEGLLSGSIALDEGDFRSTLVKLVQEQFSKMPLKDQERLKVALRVYFDKNPDLASLIDPAKAFLAVTDARYFNKANLEQRT